eukprot:TRINITY_DN12034_c0_g1_i11.p1 TRINITY_DN12034_c0_g1~~TRINITY_DN12034_c0_g1_i11.p1  ORF type:complete len:329 (+),score=90.64 TRINITY_DN12034_c0_g1_i11:28-1014(+)
MANKRIKRIKLDNELKQQLISQGLDTCGKLLLTVPDDLLELGFTREDTNEVFTAVAKAVAPQPQTVVGPAGAGKTQFSITTAAMTALALSHRDEGCVLYMDTEGAFSSERMVEIGKQRIAQDLAGSGDLVKMAAMVKVLFLGSIDELDKLLDRLEAVCVEHDVRMLILDSAASLLRKEFASGSGRRADILNKTAQVLKQLAESLYIPVLVTNQVTTRRDPSAEGSRVTAALGNTWAHSVNTRITFNYTADHQARYWHIVKSPLVANSSCGYRITPAGLEEDIDLPIPALADVAATSVPIQARDDKFSAHARSEGQHASVFAAQSTHTT